MKFISHLYIKSQMLLDLKRLYGFISSGSRRNLLLLLALQIITGASEILGLGTALPFFSAMVNPEGILRDSKYSQWLLSLDITSSAKLIVLMSALFAFATIFINTLRILTLKMQMKISANMGSELSSLMLNKMLHQDYEFHVNQNSSSTISEIVNDLNGTLSVIYNFLTFVTQTLVVFFIISALLFMYPVAALSMAIFTGFAYYFVMRISKKRLHLNGHCLALGHSKLMQILQEALGGIRDVLIDGTQKTFVKHFRDVDVPMRKANVDNLFIRMAPRFVLESVGITLLAILAAISAWRADNFSQVLPLLGTMAIAANRLLPAIQAAYASLAGIHGSQASLARTLVGLERSVDRASNDKHEFTPYALNHRLLLKNIWFKYGANNNSIDLSGWVLKDINIEIAANTTVAFVGSTGSGKSTLADIALGLLKPQRGELIIDNHPLNDLDQRSWRAGIAHVPQNIFLSDGTFIQNIAFGVPLERVDILRVKRAAKMACLSGFIESRPNGYNDLIGEKGIRLSGGQRQRIGIARALYKNASLIIFDEATSALDNVTEREVMKTIRDLSDSVTIILIAHRISTIENADLIYEIGNGEVLNAGTFSELLRISPSFRAMALPSDSQ